MGDITFTDLGIAVGINLGITSLLLLLYSIFSVQPVNARVYFTKWFSLDDQKAAKEREGGGADKVRYTWHMYVHSLDWMFVALRKPERELLEHAGLDMVVYLHMLKLGFKIFMPAMLVSAVALLPTYYTSGFLSFPTDTPVDHRMSWLTLEALQPGSWRFVFPLLCEWVFNLWALRLLRMEYQAVAQMRLDYLADRHKTPDQFTVLVRQVPKDNTRTVAQQTAQFFSVVHRDHYLMTTPVFDARKLSQLEEKRKWTEQKLTSLLILMERRPDWRPHHRTGCWLLCGTTVDSVDHYERRLALLNKQIGEERDRIATDSDAIMPANFVSFRTRWGAAVAAQTQQSKDNTKWITTWAPEPEDVCWGNLPIPYLSLSTRRAGTFFVMVVIVALYAIPVTFVQGMASLSSLAQLFPFLNKLAEMPFLSSLLTSFLPGLVLMATLAILPHIMTALSLMEGHVAHSQIQRAAAGKMFWFMVFSIFFTTVVVGSAWQQLGYIAKHPEEIPSMLDNGILASVNFFITYTVLNGWTAVAGEMVRIVPLALFHFKKALLVRTRRERHKVMAVSGPDYVSLVPCVELYFLLPFMFWVLAPLYMPFAVGFFAFAYIVYRNQFINVYVAKYDLAAGYWPDFHVRVLICLVLSQLALICVFALRGALVAALLVLPLPIVSVLYHHSFIAGAFEPTFHQLALEEVMRKDTIDRVNSPHEDPRRFLARQYLHPSLVSACRMLDEEEGGGGSFLDAITIHTHHATDLDAAAGAPLVEVKRRPKGTPRDTPLESPRSMGRADGSRRNPIVSFQEREVSSIRIVEPTRGGLTLGSRTQSLPSTPSRSPWGSARVHQEPHGV